MVQNVTLFYLVVPNASKRYAGRRTDFRDKKSSDFSGEIFRERNYRPRTAFSGSNSCSILSHPVMSWYGSRAVGCPIGREITARTCSLLGNEGTQLLFGKEAVKTFFYKCSNSGKMNPLQSYLMGTKFSGSNAAPEKSLQKNLSRKIARFLVSKISPATGVIRRSQD